MIKDVFNRGNAMVFDGGFDRVTISGLTWTPTEFTVETWLKPTGPTLSNAGNFSGSSARQFYFYTNADKSIRAGMTTSSSGYINSAANVIVPDKWNHIAFTCKVGPDPSVSNQKTISLYINGILIETKTSVITGSPWTNWNIGRANSSTIKGDMDEFRIWSKARTQQQIQENMHLISDLNAACAQGLKIYYQFEEITGGNIIEDATGNYPGFISDNPTLASSSAPVGIGVSQSNLISSAGNTDFTFAKAGLNFSGTVPNDRVVVSHITGTPPFAPPTTAGLLSSEYWIIDNYGVNTGLNVTATFTPPIGWIGATNPANYSYQKRGSNEFGAWTSPTAANAVTTSNVSYSGITSFSQFVLAAGCIETAIVDNTGQTSATSLTELVKSVCANDTITFNTALNGQIIKLIGSEINVNKNIVIKGSGVNNTIISGENLSRIFHLTNPLATVCLENLTLTNGADVLGSCIFNEGNLCLKNVVLENTNNVNSALENYGNQAKCDVLSGNTFIKK